MCLLVDGKLTSFTPGRGHYDRKEQFWGSIEIAKENLPKGTRKITEETQIIGFDVHGDEALAEVLGAMLHKRKLNWDCCAV